MRLARCAVHRMSLSHIIVQYSVREESFIALSMLLVLAACHSIGTLTPSLSFPYIGYCCERCK